MRDETTIEVAKSTQVQPRAEPMLRSAYRGEVLIGERMAECHVLDDGRAVLTTRAVVAVLFGHENGVLKQFLSRIPGGSELLAAETEIRFRTSDGKLARGFSTDFVIDVCGLYTDAMVRAKLKRGQYDIAIRAVIITRACGKLGLTALVHEATGYERARRERDLQDRLQLLLLDEAQKWQKMFTEEFWRALAWLYRIELVDPSRRPQCFGAFIWEFIYCAFDPAVAVRLRVLNPEPEFGSNHHQFFTSAGRERLARHIHAVLAVVRTSTNIDDFRMRFNAAFRGGALQLSLLPQA